MVKILSSGIYCTQKLSVACALAGVAISLLRTWRASVRKDPALESHAVESVTAAIKFATANLAH